MTDDNGDFINCWRIKTSCVISHKRLIGSDDNFIRWHVVYFISYNLSIGVTPTTANLPMCFSKVTEVLGSLERQADPAYPYVVNGPQAPQRHLETPRS